MVQGEHGYRIEHLWREPWTAIEEHHVSDWQPGTAPMSALGHGWLISPNGRHAAVIEPRVLEAKDNPNVGAPAPPPGVAFNARSVGMHWEPRPLPPIEAAEPPADDGTEQAKKQEPPAGR